MALKAGSHRKHYERIKLKTGEDYEILGQTFSNSFNKQDLQTILERYYLRFINVPCLKPPLKPLVVQSSLCEPGFYHVRYFLCVEHIFRLKEFALLIGYTYIGAQFRSVFKHLC